METLPYPGQVTRTVHTYDHMHNYAFREILYTLPHLRKNTICHNTHILDHARGTYAASMLTGFMQQKHKEWINRSCSRASLGTAIKSRYYYNKGINYIIMHQKTNYTSCCCTLASDWYNNSGNSNYNVGTFTAASIKLHSSRNSNMKRENVLALWA